MRRYHVPKLTMAAINAGVHEAADEGREDLSMSGRENRRTQEHGEP
jgi:hypothetical protein